MPSFACSMKCTNRSYQTIQSLPQMCSEHSLPTCDLPSWDSSQRMQMMCHPIGNRLPTISPCLCCLRNRFWRTRHLPTLPQSIREGMKLRSWRGEELCSHGTELSLSTPQQSLLSLRRHVHPSSSKRTTMETCLLLLGNISLREHRLTTLLQSTQERMNLHSSMVEGWCNPEMRLLWSPLLLFLLFLCKRRHPTCNIRTTMGKPCGHPSHPRSKSLRERH